MTWRWLQTLTPPAKRLRLHAATIAIALTTAVVSAGLIAVGLAQEAPKWWCRADWDHPDAGRSAEALENRLVSNIYQARAVAAVAPRAPGQSLPLGTAFLDEPVTWTIAVAAADANAWLNARLPGWLRNQSDTFEWPRQIEEIQVEFRNDKILVGARVRYAESSQFLSATLSPAIQVTDGSLWMPANVVSIGRLTLPASWFLSPEPTALAAGRIPDEIRDLPETQSLAAVFSGTIPAAQRPVVKLADGRRVRLLSLTSRDGTLEITCRTEPRQTTTTMLVAPRAN